MADNLEAHFRRDGVASSESWVYISSSEDSVFSCNSCEIKDIHIEAVGFCTDCSEYLCESCIKCHFKDRMLKQHVLLHLYRITDESDVRTGNNVKSKHLTTNEKSREADSTGDIDNLTLYKDIHVKIATDSNNCKIIGIAMLSDNSLVVADRDNKNIKVIDMENDTVRDSLKLKGRPFSFSLLSNDQLAVTLSDVFMINILSTTGGLNVVKTFRVDGSCCGVVSFKDKLLVSFHDPLVFEIIDLNGRVVEKVIVAPDVSSICTRPRHLDLSPDEKTLYISDWKSNVCLTMDMKGNKIAEYTDIETPAGIVYSPQFDCIILCVMDKHCIRKMTSDLKGSEIVLNRGDGLSFPCALCVSPEQRQLIVSSTSNRAERRNFIKIFQF